MCVSFLLLFFKFTSGCLFSPRHVNQGGVQRLPHKSLFTSLFTSPTLLKGLSGDANVAGTARYCLVMRAKRGNPCTHTHTHIHTAAMISLSHTHTHTHSSLPLLPLPLSPTSYIYICIYAYMHIYIHIYIRSCSGAPTAKASSWHKQVMPIIYTYIYIYI